MIFRIFKKILSVAVSAVLMLPLFACSADHAVKDLYDAYVAEKDSLIVDRHEAEESSKVEESVSATEQVLTAGQTGGALPEKKQDSDQNRRETSTSVESVRSEVSSEVEDPSGENAYEKEDPPDTEETEFLSDGEDLSAEMSTDPSLEGTETAESYAEEGEGEASLGSAAFVLAPGAGSEQVLELDMEGTIFTLTARETVYDVTVEGTGMETEDYRHQFADSFHAEVLESGGTITIQARVDSDMPDLCISWTNSEGASYTKFISASAKDDVLMLVTVE